jgi:2-C-methyl-D-erythritol 2,4-cyclodiphosphate synthase
VTSARISRTPIQNGKAHPACFSSNTLDEKHLRITHLDAVVICERPKLGPHFPAMRDALAKSLGINQEQINLKAKTNEGTGEIGRGEAVAAHTIATLEG